MASSADPDHRWVLLGRDGQISVRCGSRRATSSTARVAGLHHMAFNVTDIDAVRDAEAELRRLGIDPLHGGVVPLVHGGDGAALYFHDPDGTRLEISSAVGHVDRRVSVRRRTHLRLLLMTSPWRPGERAVQDRMGMTAAADEVAVR